MPQGEKRSGLRRSKGSKKGGEPTRVIRVPVSMAEQIERFVAQNGVGCPYFESAVQAGFPSPAEGDYSGPLDIVSHLIPHPENVRLVRVTDESMVGAGIYPDDILIADKTLPPRDGDVVVLTHLGDILIRRLLISDREIRLRAENDDFETVRVERDGIEILGVVRHSVHTLHGPNFFL